MPERAHVRSVAALESFRANLIIYLSKARPTLDEVGADVVRLREWLEREQRGHWEREARRRRRAWDEARQALFSAQLSNFREESAAELMAVQRTKRAMDEAEGKLRVIKQWVRVFDNRTGPLVKQMEKLHTVLAQDMVQGAAFLSEAINRLEAYAAAGPPGGVSGGGAGTGGQA